MVVGNSIDMKKWLRIVKAACAIMRKERRITVGDDYVQVNAKLYDELQEAVKDLDNDGSENDRPGQVVESTTRSPSAESGGP